MLSAFAARTVRRKGLIPWAGLMHALPGTKLLASTDSSAQENGDWRRLPLATCPPVGNEGQESWKKRWIHDSHSPVRLLLPGEACPRPPCQGPGGSPEAPGKFAGCVCLPRRHSRFDGVEGRFSAGKASEWRRRWLQPRLARPPARRCLRE